MPATTIGLVSVLISMILSPEIKGHVYSADVMVTYAIRTPPILVGGENSMGALTAMQSHQAVIAETLVSWSPRRKVGHLGSNSQHRGELHEPARPISDERESGTGNSLRHILVTWHRSSADYAVRRRWSHRAPFGPHHPADTRAETADDRCAGCAQRHSAWTLRGQSPIQRPQRAGRAAR